MNIAPYLEISPRIVRTGRRQTVTLRPRYPDFLLPNLEPLHFPDGASFELTVRGLYRFSDPHYRTISLTAAGNCLSFEWDFEAEQEYAVFIRPLSGPHADFWEIETSLYALDDDLYGLQVLKGDFHNHTSFSDGYESPVFRAATARQRGFDFLAVTDHNNYAGSVHLIEAMRRHPHNMVFLHGEEVHAEGCPVHILSLGAREAICPKVSVADGDRLTPLRAEYRDRLPEGVDLTAFVTAKDVFERIREAGGLSVLCHIYWDGLDYDAHKRNGIPEALARALAADRSFDAFELVSGYPASDPDPNYLQNAFYQEYLLGQGVPVIGISDTHTTLPADSVFGKNYSVVFARQADETGILEAVRRGHSLAICGSGGKAVCHGSLRLVKYGRFLLRHYFPYHDRKALSEGLLMERFALQEDTRADGRFDALLGAVCSANIDDIRKEWGIIPIFAAEI